MQGRRTGYITPILFAAAGLAVGAGLALFFAPSTGPKVRAFVRDLFRRNQDVASTAHQLDALDNEGGARQPGNVKPASTNHKDAHV